jgi:hypothetical protein
MSSNRFEMKRELTGDNVTFGTLMCNNCRYAENKKSEREIILFRLLDSEL